MSAVSPFASLRPRLYACLPLFVAAVLLVGSTCDAQLQPISFTSSALPAKDAGVSSSYYEEDVDAPTPRTNAASAADVQGESRHSILHAIGSEIHFGANGAGGDIALPVAYKWNVRLGGQFAQYTGNFTSDGAQIKGTLKVGNGKFAVDWFPFNNGFHISPQVYFAIKTDINAAVVVPAGQTVSFSDTDYISSASDPLTGTAHVTTRSAAPGLSIGWGNISPRSRAHWSFPVEIGFYYIGQPTLAVTFNGTACDPREAAPDNCSKVANDPDFQSDFARFIARNNNNLKYASFFPIAQTGVGYRF